MTRFANVTKREAVVIVCGLVLLIGYGLASFSQVFPPRESKETDGEDVRMYQSVIERIHGGEAYYEVVGEELRARGYALRPFFNWRLPTIAWAVAHLPTPEWGRWVLAMLALLTMFLWFQVLDRERGFQFALAGVMLLSGPLLLCLSEQGFYYHELWAGILIALSLAAHAQGNKTGSIVIGILAIFIRELALPYVLTMLVLAWKQNQNREMMGWLGGVTIFAICLVFHASIVHELQLPMDQVNESWIQFGGWPFVLSTGVWNAFLFVSPKWIVAFVLPLSLLGVIGWKESVGIRVALTLGVYYCSFLIAGRVNNTYWGFMYAPLVPLGLLYAFPSLFDLVKILKERQPLSLL